MGRRVGINNEPIAATSGNAPCADTPPDPAEPSDSLPTAAPACFLTHALHFRFQAATATTGPKADSPLLDDRRATACLLYTSDAADDM
eukprot:15189869-Alexandrium_andersonii.AAC.1